MAVGESEKQTLRLYAAAVLKQGADELRPEGGESLHDGIHFMHQGTIRRFVAQFEYRPLGHREDESVRARTVPQAFETLSVQRFIRGVGTVGELRRIERAAPA